MGLAVDEEGKNAASIGEDVGGKTVEGLEVKGSVKVFEVENFGEFFGIGTGRGGKGRERERAPS